MSDLKYSSITIRLTEQEKTEFKILCARYNTTVSEYIREMIKNELKETRDAR